MRGLCKLLACLLAASAWLPAGAADGGWWRSPATPEIAWRGMLPTEGGAVGGSVQMLYPGFAGIGGFVAAILTHAAISGGVQSAARKREQDEADKVLEPYAATLKAWTAQDLWSATQATLGSGLALQFWEQAVPPQGLLIETTPVFTMAPDEGVLILDAAVRLTPVKGPANEQMVRVLSSPHDAADARKHWSDDEASRLKATAVQMLADAIRMALAPAPAAETLPPTRTHRYLQGNVERAERAQQMGGDCARALLRTLRGGLLSVPLKPAEGIACERRTAY
jgi:hypothetical protein